MRLGTRWASGDEPPASVPSALRAQIARVDGEIDDEQRPRWTLTWLEGRPVAELETGVVVSLSPTGAIVVGQIDDDET
ncbi:hypothetical protein [Microbacterium radiodurans]|uniref:Fe-S oxidoreductase n=1 Tax=Microbacterium radiodurans TaxID=661398 RepID=A0A5J5IR93_9MICO|nr:hypothetical protein [Microbacterium radiodurans]KAA9086820.1 hypothetical protein F6B42_07420 [Microbacterium radiodurans]